MKRVRRLTQFWNWLPAFRAVAETEHLPSAAEQLGMSAPGLSRMIKLIENALEQPLFHRRARRLELNEAGQLFLGHVRDAMRRVDDGLAELDDRAFTGRLKIAASNSTSQIFVLPALERLRSDYPRLVPELSSVEEEEASERLLSGDIDLAILERAEADDELAVERLGTLTYGIYAAAGHPLCVARDLDVRQCLDYAFVAASGGAFDMWPPNLRRRVALYVNALNLALAACAAGELLAFLPDAVASRYVEPLRRLDLGILAEQPVFMAYRPRLGALDRVGALVESLREVARATPALAR